MIINTIFIYILLIIYFLNVLLIGCLFKLSWYFVVFFSLTFSHSNLTFFKISISSRRFIFNGSVVFSRMTDFLWSGIFSPLKIILLQVMFIWLKSSAIKSTFSLAIKSLFLSAVIFLAANFTASPETFEFFIVNTWLEIIDTLVFSFSLPMLELFI